MTHNEEKRKRSLIDDEVHHLCREISLESKRLRSDILGILEDDGDADEKSSEIESTADELLNSVMRSLQDEIDGEDGADVREQPDLGYLLGASDDELGLPPAGSEEALTEDVLGEIRSLPGPEMTDLAGFWNLDESIPSYGMQEFGFFGVEERRDDEEEHENVIESLFDFTDASSPSGYSSMGLWRPESVPSL